MLGENAVAGLALLIPTVGTSVYYVLARPLHCRRCGGRNLGPKVAGYRCRHCGVKFSGRSR
jgi:tRNA(Ile2) C34 agmatinyltransferase TiaS